METTKKIIPFNLYLARQIHGGGEKGRILTRAGGYVRNIVFNVRNDLRPISAIIQTDWHKEDTFAYKADGTCIEKPGDYDLVLEVDEVKDMQQTAESVECKDGDICTLGWERGNEYCEWVTILKSVEYVDDTILTRDYVSVRLRSDSSNDFSTEFDTTSDAARWIRKSTKSEVLKLVQELKQHPDCRAKELLKKHFAKAWEDNKTVTELIVDAYKPGQPTDHKNDRKDSKPRWELLPIEVIEEAVKVYTFGAEKYGVNTWQNLENGKERYYAALMRHLVAWRKGEKVDEESGLSPLAHVLWNVISLIWLEKNDGEVQNTEG